MDLISQHARLVTPINVSVQRQFPSDWNEAMMAQAIGFIDDEIDGKVLLLFEDGPGSRAGVRVGIHGVQFVRPARRADYTGDGTVDPLGPETVAADPTGTGEGGIPPLDRASAGQGADQLTKVYLEDRKGPILVYGELEVIKAHMVSAKRRVEWVQLQRVNDDAVVSPDDIVINPAYVVSLQSERL